MTKPSMRWEYPEVHLLNFTIFGATLFCFEFFWRFMCNTTKIKMYYRMF